MCGEHKSNVMRCAGFGGSSPHVRGAHDFMACRIAARGIIPACAGSTRQDAGEDRPSRDHPRMCGEHGGFSAKVAQSKGSSPHVRGALQEFFPSYEFRGIIPACAGSTQSRRTRLHAARDHPRMCGEHARPAGLVAVELGSSPHVRGAHFENSIIPRKRKDNWLFFIQFRFENFLAFRYLLALLHPFLGVPTKDPSFASLGRLINCNPSQSTGDQSAPYTLKAICCSFLAE